MIYTLTINPSLDIKISLKDVSFVSGGKGINISTLLAKENIQSTALGFIGGKTGEEISYKLDKRIIKDFVYIKENSRTNYKIFIDKEIEINNEGPNVSLKEKEELLNKLINLKNDDLLIISGSSLKCLTNNFYEEIVSNIKCKFIVDARNELLLNTLKYHPELIKPNINELEELFNIKINNLNEVKKYAYQLLEIGAKRVIVSLGEKGLIFVSNKLEKYLEPAKGKVLSTIGAGDALIAGYVLGFIQNKSEEECLDLAIKKANQVVFEGVLL